MNINIKAMCCTGCGNPAEKIIDGETMIYFVCNECKKTHIEANKKLVELNKKDMFDYI